MVRDLAGIHRPIGEMFPWPASRDCLEAFRLTPEQIAHFEENGYVAGIRVLDDRQIDALNEALARLTDRNQPGHSLFYEFHSNESSNQGMVLFHALGAWRIEEVFHDILWNPAFLVPASQLLGGAIRFWHDQLFSKPALHGGVVAWHQDYSYWTRTAPVAHLTCWIGLDDSTRENGCLHYIPGSHKWNLLPITGLAGAMHEIMTVLSDEQKAAFRPVPVELKRGECSFHHSLTVHGSYENRANRPRRATVINVFRDGVRSASDEPPLEGVPPVPKRQPMGGTFFPLLFDPDRDFPR
ncbi:MAG: phytanoyl-CoA dioxygenase family protein [Acidobacteria bacterium]|nr:phytanoyl-CoA dioxygenase family protein [Acidobacteriota bacterium]